MTEEEEKIKRAAKKWVSGFNSIPTEIIRKLAVHCGEEEFTEVREITPPKIGSRVYIYDKGYGEIIDGIDEQCCYMIRLDDWDKIIKAPEYKFDVIYDNSLPAWSEMWSFGDKTDMWWLDEPHNQNKMAACGFRIYEQKDFGYIFGVDNIGYNLCQSRWIPLYKARGLEWHIDLYN
jgi:hypothetical protein